jgi:ribonuclease III
MNDDMPFNHCNRLVSPKELSRLVKNYKNIDLYRKAFTHKSYCIKKNDNLYNNNYCQLNCVLLQETCNERLEFLGDSILSSSVAHYLYERYSDQNEGFLTKVRSRLVNGDMLCHLAKRLDIAKYILISKQIENTMGRYNKKILEDTLEALIASIYLDLGYDYAKEWIINLIESNVDFAQIISAQCYKDQYFKLYQNKYGVVPVFQVDPKSHGKTITVNIINMNGDIICSGSGKTKRIAEEKAASKAMGITS